MGKKLFPVAAPSPSTTEEAENSLLTKTREVDGRRLTVVDTGGLRDYDLVDQEDQVRQADEVMRWLTECSPGPHAFVFVMNLYAYHQRLSRDADRVEWVTEGVAEEGMEMQEVEEETERQTNEQLNGTTEEYLSDAESAGKDVEREASATEQRVQSAGQRTGEASPSTAVGLLRVLRYFGEEALKYTVLVFTHGDKLSLESCNALLQEDTHLKELVDMCGGGKHTIVGKSWKKKDQVKKLMSIIEEMIIKNGGGHYANESLKAIASRRQAKSRVRLAKLLRLACPMILPPPLDTLDLSAEGIERLKKTLQKMAFGAVAGAIVGGALGASLKVVTFALERVGPSMMVYLSLLVMPLIIGGASPSIPGGFSISAISGGVVLGFVLMMTIVGATMGSIVGGNAAIMAKTYKEAVQFGGRAVIDKEKAAFFTALKKVQQLIRGEEAGQAPGESSEDPESAEDGAEETGEPDADESDRKNVPTKTETKAEGDGQKITNASLEGVTETSNQQPQTTEPDLNRSTSKPGPRPGSIEGISKDTGSQMNTESTSSEQSPPNNKYHAPTANNPDHMTTTNTEYKPDSENSKHQAVDSEITTTIHDNSQQTPPTETSYGESKPDHKETISQLRPESCLVELPNKEIGDQISGQISSDHSPEDSYQKPDTTDPDHRPATSPVHKPDSDKHTLQGIHGQISAINTNAQQNLPADTRGSNTKTPGYETTNKHSEKHENEGIQRQVSFRDPVSVLSHSAKVEKKHRTMTQV